MCCVRAGRIQVFAWRRRQLCLGWGPAGVGFMEAGSGCPTVPRRPSSRPRVRPRVAAFHLSDSVWLGVQHFLLVTKLSYRQTVSCREKRLGVEWAAFFESPGSLVAHVQHESPCGRKGEICPTKGLEAEPGGGARTGRRASQRAASCPDGGTGLAVAG